VSSADRTRRTGGRALHAGGACGAEGAGPCGSAPPARIGRGADGDGDAGALLGASGVTALGDGAAGAERGEYDTGSVGGLQTVEATQGAGLDAGA
jgi:hypothetical protein